MADLSKLNIQLGGKGKGKALTRGRLPTKRYINLATINEKKFNFKAAIPAVILVIAASVLLAKVAVLDRLSEVYAEEAKVTALQRQVDAAYDRIDSFGELTEQYAHYTYSGMTSEELNRADRILTMDLIDRVLRPRAKKLDSWQITGNMLSLNITGNTLQEINLLAQQLREEPMVEFVNVTTAHSEGVEDEEIVTARMVIYLTNPPEPEQTEEVQAQ